MRPAVEPAVHHGRRLVVVFREVVLHDLDERVEVQALLGFERLDHRAILSIGLPDRAKDGTLVRA